MPACMWVRVSMRFPLCVCVCVLGGGGVGWRRSVVTPTSPSHSPRDIAREARLPLFLLLRALLAPLKLVPSKACRGGYKGDTHRLVGVGLELIARLPDRLFICYKASPTPHQHRAQKADEKPTRDKTVIQVFVCLLAWEATPCPPCPGHPAPPPQSSHTHRRSGPRSAVRRPPAWLVLKSPVKRAQSYCSPNFFVALPRADSLKLSKITADRDHRTVQYSRYNSTK